MRRSACRPSWSASPDRRHGERRGTARRTIRPGQVIVLLAAPATLAWLGWEQRWVAEDAFIDLRVVQHLLAGHGPVFNLGERVEVYTNPLWVALLAVLGLPFALARPVIPLDVPLEWIAVLAGL
ncbi:MAG TPA: hypothetical protein VHN78_03365, partial [Chloroflexota bacterium]|nr:hypothetical protein [Chloroflexota bacterium]